VAIGVNNEGYREILGAAEGMKEDHESWRNFFVWLKERGLKGVRLILETSALIY
jgi:transposase, mutator family